jgi:Ni,Fe-hydrogenase III large subunit
MANESDDAKEIKVDYTRLRVPFGPVHPALKEPISFKVTVRKEEILDVDIRLGHVHRGIARD